MRSHHAVLLTALLACLILTGCQSQAPRGSTGGRIDPYQTTGSDRRSDSAHIPSMLEFTDQTAQQLAMELTSIPELQTAEGRLVLELGTIDNQTRTPTNDFRQIQRRLRSALLQNPQVREKFIVVESGQRMDEELGRITGQQAGTTRYSPEITYILQGDFYESIRNRRSQYYFNFKLTHLASRAIVFDSSFDLGQVR